MTADETESGRRDTGAWFTTTHWSVVMRAARADTPQSSDALARLCKCYWYPLYAYVRRRGHSPEDAQDLTQEFFARLLRQEGLRTAHQDKGRFRSFLLAAMNHFLCDEWDKNRAQKRGSGAEAVELAEAELRYALEASSPGTPQDIYERRWALALLDEVLGRLASEYHAENKTELFSELKPCLTGERTDVPYAELGRKLGLSESAVKSAVHRLRRRYRTLLRGAIAQTVSSKDEVEDELKHLFSVLGR